MKLLSLQIALFSKNPIDRPDLLMNKVNERLGNILDDMPSIQNIPLNFPADIPIAQVNSKSGEYALNVSRNRVDLTLNYAYDSELSVADSFKQRKSVIEKYYKSVFDSTPVIRMGMVSTLFEPMQNNVQAIYEKYFKIPCPAGTIEATVRTNTQTLQKRIVYNNIKNVQAVEINAGNSTERGVMIQLDINNVVQPELLTIENLSEMVAYTAKRFSPKEIKELI